MLYFLLPFLLLLIIIIIIATILADASSFVRFGPTIIAPKKALRFVR